MIIKRQQEIEGIMKGLSLLQYYMKFSSNKLGLHNINKICEPFFADLFNIMHGFHLKTFKNNNHPAIDLADKSHKYSVQITSDGSKQKLKHTIEAFEKEELYKKYKTLLHFVVGEKHFSPSKKDPYEFKKGSYNMYYTDVCIGKHTYQIIIQDIYDLLLSINDKNSNELTRIYDYIDKNINKFIDNIKRPLYNFEPGEVEPFTATSYIASCGIEKDHQKKFKNELENLANRLNEIPEDTRQFIFYAIQAEEESYGSGIQVNVALLKGRLGLSPQQLRDEIDILRGSKMIDSSALEQDNLLILEYFDSDGNELLKEIFNFCKNNNRSFEDLIVHVNFSQLN